MQKRYQELKESQQTTKGGLADVRMTHAELGRDKFIKARLAAQSALEGPRAEFKLKRFQQVDPRTSTKRGDHPFMSLKMNATGEVVKAQVPPTPCG